MLKDKLRGLLGWEDIMLDSLISAINGASPSELGDCLEVLGDNPEAKAAVRAHYATLKKGEELPEAARVASGHGVSSSSSGSRSTQVQKTPTLVPYTRPQLREDKPSKASPSPSSVDITSDLQKDAPTGKGGEKVFGMFKQGGRAPKPRATRRDDMSLASAEGLEKKVVNCLSCGKIFDCRNVTNEIINFLGSGGICTFCGSPVALKYSDPKHQQQQQEQAAITQAQAPTPTPGTTPDMDGGRAEAVALKDRLVAYGRDGVARTNVIDDQADYFEIDSNEWLTDAERQQLRRQKALEEEALAAKKKKFVVTLDLLGRKVLMADSEEANSLAANTTLSGAAPRAPVTSAAPSAVPTAQVGAETRPASSPNEISDALVKLRDLRISANPHLAMPAPLFLPSSAKKQESKVPTADNKAHPEQGKQQKTAGSHQLVSRTSKKDVPSHANKRTTGRLQTDFDNAFVDLVY